MQEVRVPICIIKLELFDIIIGLLICSFHWLENYLDDATAAMSVRRICKLFRGIGCE